jgi:hypothetical protein
VRALSLTACLVALVPAAAVGASERPSREVPRLARAPKPDGKLQDFPATLTLKPAAPQGASASFKARVGWHKDMLYVGVEAQDDSLLSGDALTLTLFFPGAGPIALGHTFRFGPEGKQASPAESGTPEHAWKSVQAGIQRAPQLVLEAALPARGFPRFPPREPLVLDLCLTYEDTDGAAAAPPPISNCQGGSMRGEVLQLPEAFRKGLKLEAPKDVTGFEGRPEGWLGYDTFRYPAWVQADAALTPSRLKALVASQAVEPGKAGLNVPETLSLKDGRPLVAVVSGQEPSTGKETCDPARELLLGLYLVKGQTAVRVLEWPVATCALGRASSFELDEEGALSIGYSSGAIINFAWSGNHFERTEMGKR